MRRSLRVVPTAILGSTLVLAGQVAPAQAATKYAVTCAVGGQTQVSKTAGATEGWFTWTNAAGTIVGSATIGTTDGWSKETPANAKTVRVQLWMVGQVFVGCR